MQTLAMHSSESGSPSSDLYEDLLGSMVSVSSLEKFPESVPLVCELSDSPRR